MKKSQGLATLRASVQDFLCQSINLEIANLTTGEQVPQNVLMHRSVGTTYYSKHFVVLFKAAVSVDFETI
jgi:hypothetical protein